MCEHERPSAGSHYPGKGAECSQKYKNLQKKTEEGPLMLNSDFMESLPKHFMSFVQDHFAQAYFK